MTDLMDVQRNRLANLATLRDDLELYARQCLRIRTKTGDTIPFVLNKPQRHLHARLEAQRARTGMVRALVLKGRQQGASTYIGARFYHRAALNRGLQVYILTHEQDATDTLFKMVDRYHRHNPLRPSTGASNARELLFDRLDSGYSVGTAGAKGAGRSKTVQLFHGSEAAYWPNAASHFSGVVQAVPSLPGTEVILESTAAGLGGEFHERWQQAEGGIGDYQAIFIPWFWSAEYRRAVDGTFTLDEEEAEYAALHGLDDQQMAWRRAKLAELNDPLKFKQEYPATAAEAFQSTGHDSFIKAAEVMAARKARCSGVGPLVIGVDPKREGKDRFSIAWRQGRKLLKVQSDASPIETLEAAAKLRGIIDRDRPARLFIDVGGNGAGIFDVLVGWDDKYRKVCALVNFGSSPFNPPPLDDDGKEMAGYLNRRAEMWALSRDWLKQEGGADIPDLDSLQSDACGPGFHYHPQSSKLVLESKEHMVKVRKLRSPDEWDAVALTFAEPVGDSVAAQKIVLPNYGVV